VPALISTYNTAKRIQAAERLNGIQPLNGWLALVMYLLIAPVFWAYEQSELNKVWQQGGEAPKVEAAESVPADLDPGATTPRQSGPETTQFR
jgi:hypothetical protein